MAQSERGKRELVLRLRELLPSSQEDRAEALGAGQSTVQRWEAQAAEGEEPNMGPSSYQKLLSAVQRFEQGPTDFDRGRLSVIEEMEEVLQSMRARLPQEPSEETLAKAQDVIDKEYPPSDDEADDDVA